MKYQIDLSLKDLASSAVAKVRKEFERLSKKTEEAQARARIFGNICERIGNLQFKNFIDMLDRSVQAFGEATGSGMEYEQAMADLVAITGIAGKELEEIGRVARQTGKESGLGATGAVNAFTLLASQIQIDKIGLQGLMALQKETITLAQAAGMDMAEAGTALRNILLKMQTVLGMDFSQTGLDTALKPKLSDVSYLAKLFGAENIAVAQYLIANAQAVGELTRQVTGTSVAQEQAALRTDTAAEAYKRLRAQMDDVKIAFFEATGALSPYIAVTGDALPILASFMAVVGSCSQTIAFFQKNAILAKTAVVAKTAAELAVVGAMKLVAGLVYAYNRSEPLRQVVDGLWDGLKRVAAVVGEHVVKAFEAFLNGVQKAWDAVRRSLPRQRRPGGGGDRRDREDGRRERQRRQAHGGPERGACHAGQIALYDRRPGGAHRRPEDKAEGGFASERDSHGEGGQSLRGSA